MKVKAIKDKEIIESRINCILEEFDISDKNSELIHQAIIGYCKFLIIGECGGEHKVLKKEMR